MSIVVRGMTAEDWPAVQRIYAEGIAGGNATFETATPTWDHFDQHRVAAPRLVAQEARSGAVLGWAAASRVSARPVYAGVLEHAVYVAASTRGQGVGRALLARFVQDSEAAGFWSLRAGIFPENEPSLHLHRALGFREVGRWERVGRHHGRWRDVVVLERRSPLTGVD